MSELLGIFGTLVFGICCLVILAASIWNIFIIASLAKTMTGDDWKRMFARKSKGEDGLCVVKLKGRAGMNVLDGDDAEEQARFALSRDKLMRLRLNGQMKDDVILWTKALDLLDKLGTAEILLVALSDDGFPQWSSDAPILYDATGTEEAVISSRQLALVVRGREKKISYSGWVTDDLAMSLGYASCPDLAWEVQQLAASNRLPSPPFAAMAKALTLGHENIPEKFVQLPQNLPIELSTPSEAFFSARDQGYRIKDVVTIWKKCSENVGLALYLAPDDIVQPSEKLMHVASLLGVDECLDAYYAGVPIADIIA